MSKSGRAYEWAFAELMAAPAALAFAMGQQALVVLLRALGAEAGEPIGLCACTCLSVAEAVEVPVGRSADSESGRP